jgi:hypothetical protein
MTLLRAVSSLAGAGCGKAKGDVESVDLRGGNMP